MASRPRSGRNGGDPAAAPVQMDRRSPLAFFALAFGLAAPFWLAGALTEAQLLPGLPDSALMAVCPLIAASILVWRQRGFAGVRHLL